MSLEKKFSKYRSTCKVTFIVPKEATRNAQTIHLVGDFNHWNEHSTPMKKKKNGSFELTLKLQKGKEYQFRYFIDQYIWENDWKADKYVPTHFGDSENSVVVL